MLRNVRTSSLKKYFHIIYMVQWLIIHLYIHRTSVLKHLKQYKLTFFFFKLTLHIGKCKTALSVHVESVLTVESCRPLRTAPVLKGTVTWMNLNVCGWGGRDQTVILGHGENFRKRWVLPAELCGSNYVTQEHTERFLKSKWWSQTLAQAASVQDTVTSQIWLSLTRERCTSVFFSLFSSWISFNC